MGVETAAGDYQVSKREGREPDMSRSTKMRRSCLVVVVRIAGFGCLASERGVGYFFAIIAHFGHCASHGF